MSDRSSPFVRRGPGSWTQTASWIVLLAAVGTRLELYFHNRSFWLDESLLGLNLIEKSPHRLLQSLDYVQTAPPGFLLAEKGMIGLLGESEHSLRLIPLLASIGSLLLVRQVAGRLLSPGAALLALTLFAANDEVIYQSSEAKPYSLDVFATLLLFWLTVRALEHVDSARVTRSVLSLTVAGAALVWFSYPLVMVVATCYATLLLRAWSRRDMRTVRTFVAAGAAVAASEGAAYLVSARSISRVHSVVFIGDPHASSHLKAVAQAAWVSITDPGGFPIKLRALAFLCLVAGAVAIAARSLERATLLVGPGVLAAVASFVDAYPLGFRYSLFLAPSIAILAAAGVAALRNASRRPTLVGIPLVLLIAGFPVSRAIGTALHPPAREHIRPLLHTLARNWRPGDTLYVYRNAQYALRFYDECRDCGAGRLPFAVRDAPPATDNGGFPAALVSAPPTVIVGTGRPRPSESLRALDALRNHRRIWLLFSHSSLAAQALDEEELFLAYVDTFGRRLGSWSEPGAALYLYDTRRG